MITFLLMNLIVGASAFLLVYKVFKIINFIDSLVSCFIFYLAQIVLTEIILGVFNILYIENLILINSVILFSIWLIAKDKPSILNLDGLNNVIAELIKNKIVLLGVSILLAFGLVKIGINLVNPPFGWDDLNYHFTFPVEWLKHGNLDTPIVISDDPSPTYYPINGSLFFLWFMFPLKSVFLADLGQVPFFILAFLAIYSIARKLDLGRDLSFYAAALFMLIPNIFKQLGIAYVDVMVAALFFTCVNYLFLLEKEFSLRNVLVYSMSLGLLLGIKTLALPYSILLVIPFIYLLFRNVNKSYLCILPIFAIFTLGGFTYIRNFIDTGNPLYPLNLKLFGRTILKGVMDSSVYRSHFKIGDYSLSKMLFHEGLGAQTLIFILPAIFLALPVALIKKRRALTFNLVYFLILPVLTYLIYRYVIPLVNTRYLYPLLGIGIIISFYIINILNLPQLIINILVSVSMLASIGELAKRQELITSIIFTFLLFFLLLVIRKYITKIKFIRRPFFISLFLIIIIYSLVLSERGYLNNEYPGYIKMVKYSGFWPDATRAWGWLNKNTEGNNIAYIGRPVPFPLYGTNFKNNVYYVSVNKTDPAKLHYFPNSNYRWGYDFLNMHKNLEEKDNYRGLADYSAWLNNLTRHKTDYLFIYSLHQTKDIEFPMEDKWAKGDPERFNPVFVNQTIHIYKIIK